MLLFVSWLLHTAQANTLTVSFPPTPAPKAVAMLGKLSGLKLAVAPVLADEVVLARLKDADVDVALSHLAEALCAKWDRSKDGTLWLNPNPKAKQALDDAEASEANGHLQNSLKYLKKRLAEQPPELDQKQVTAFQKRNAAEIERRKLAEAKQDYDHMFTESSVTEEAPGWRALAQILLQLDSRDLLAMPNDSREVLAENPTSMQHPFSQDAQHVLAQYRRELSLLDPSATPTRIMVVLKKWEHGSALNTTLTTTDHNGKTIDSAFVRMNDDSERLKIPFSTRSRIDPKPNEAPLTYPRDTDEARIALSNSYKGKDRLAILSAWRSKLMDPVRYEPTQWHDGQDLVLAAEATDKQLIGTINDLVSATYFEAKKITPSQLLAKNAANFLPTQDGWLVVRSGERLERSSRSKGKALLAKCVRAGGIGVDDAATWVAASHDRWPFTCWLGDYLHVLFSGSGPYSALSTTMDDVSLRFWASLNAATHEALRRGATVDLGKLSSSSQTQIYRIVYWFEGLDESKMDVTDRLPNSISDGTLTMTVKEIPVFYGWSAINGPPPSPAPMDAATFGKFLAKGNTWNEIPAGVYRQYDQFKVGLNRAYELHFLFNPGSVPMTIRLTETLFVTGTSAISQLPPEITKSVETARLAALAQPVEKQDKLVIPPR